MINTIDDDDDDNENEQFMCDSYLNIKKTIC